MLCSYRNVLAALSLPNKVYNSICSICKADCHGFRVNSWNLYIPLFEAWARSAAAHLIYVVTSHHATYSALTVS
jgi:hypothetical protein